MPVCDLGGGGSGMVKDCITDREFVRNTDSLSTWFLFPYIDVVVCIASPHQLLSLESFVGMDVCTVWPFLNFSFYPYLPHIASDVFS